MRKNLLPLIGMVFGFALIFWSISTSGPLSGFLDGPSLVITLIGSFCALLISFPMKALKKVPALLKQLFMTPENDRVTIIDSFFELSKKIRSNGVLSIEEEINEFNNDIMVHGLQMVVDGKDGESIRSILELELDQTENRHSVGQEVFNKWGEYAPAFGMIGTLIGLIAMLGDLDDPSMIGAGMATALLTTFYGSMLANLVFLPIAKNLEYQSEEEMTTNEMIIEGILALQEGQNPRVIEQKLMSFLSSEEKKAMESEERQNAIALGKQEG